MKIESIERLRFEGLGFRFDGQDFLFENVDFEFPMDRIVWVKAEHGNGRSTLLQILAALQMPTKGSYWINDANVGEMSFEEFLPFRLAIGYGFDTGGLIHNRTLFENLMLPLNYHKTLSGHDAASRVTHYLKEFGLWKYRDQRPSFIPGASRKIACLLRSIILHPQLLLLDDPTVGLSQDTALKYFDVLQHLRDQKILRHVFMSSFDEKFMGLMDCTQIHIDGGILHRNPDQFEKKAVAL